MRFAFGKAFFVAFGVEIAAGVRCVDFVHQVDSAVVLAEFVLGVDENQAAFCSDFRTAFEERHCIFLQNCILFGGGQAFGKNLLFGDVGVMLADFGFCGRGDDGFGEFLVLLHAFGQLYAADFADTALVGAPCTAAEIAAYNHLNREAFAHYAHGYHRVGGGCFPVGADVGGGIEELGCNLVQHLSFERNTFRQYYVES